VAATRFAQLTVGRAELVGLEGAVVALPVVAGTEVGLWAASAALEGQEAAKVVVEEDSGASVEVDSEAVAPRAEKVGMAHWNM
jgi:hypothetical protein